MKTKTMQNTSRLAFYPSSIKLFFVIFLLFSFSTNGQTAPHLKHDGKSIKLIVDDKPMLLISGELRNSASSTLPYAGLALDRCKKLGLNSVIATISWEEFEPTEGTYDYTLIDGLIKQAKSRDLKLVIIWFASFKNGKMTYAPAWVKKNTDRFPRVLSAKHESGNRKESPDVFNRFKGQKEHKRTLSPVFKETWEADAKAFAMLMRRIKQVDKNHTVVMVQVQNEAGLQDVALDQQPESLRKFESEIPKILFDYLQVNQKTLTPELAKAWSENGHKLEGNWTQVFGELAHDTFAAWQVASFMEEVTAAGKAEYNLPMFYNAWVKLHGDEPGDYPTGGPIHTMLDIYRCASPSIDLLAPDLYVSSFKEYCIAYRHPGNALLIPECRLNEDAIAKAYWAFASENAIGFAPFGIEEAPTDTNLTEGYRVLRQLQPLIIDAQGTDRIRGFYRQDFPESKVVNVGTWSFSAGELEKPDASEVHFKMGKYKFTLQHNKKIKNTPSYGLMIQIAEDEFLVTGKNIILHWDTDALNQKADTLSIIQGEYENGKWVTQRRLNGDSGTSRAFFPSPTNTFAKPGQQDITRIKLYTYNAVPGNKKSN